MYGTHVLFGTHLLDIWDVWDTSDVWDTCYLWDTCDVWDTRVGWWISKVGDIGVKWKLLGIETAVVKGFFSKIIILDNKF